ncbi:hypothetical protein HG535_0G05260 [Zygotorulaspora mrakii]|uniref:Thymidylate kinase n=1 Tax=Zygotorulaspora mrakii TaxID=42260 RepID=A0A7H9B811_ZYGMR|nr:uncharacterized protein HG535_0G05260 [Zygotorulaspora mrakii]QLG74643.1 hypothetical protein HG535_0G05260 [Zygotorulaspora mrakii]
MTRGKLILIEGLDRTGKTTQCTILVQRLKPNAELRKFPDRTTQIGKLIDEYLTEEKSQLPDQAIHLLFSANRWEVAEKIKESLSKGEHVVMDRYVYSGIAYSAAKETKNMNLEWCLQPDKGLLKPDLTIFLTNEDHRDLEVRDGFGSERYEKSDFQMKVKEKFFETFEYLNSYTHDIKDDLKVIDVTNKSIEEVSQRIWDVAKNIIDEEGNREFSYF